MACLRESLNHNGERKIIWIAPTLNLKFKKSRNIQSKSNFSYFDCRFFFKINFKLLQETYTIRVSHSLDPDLDQKGLTLSFASDFCHAFSVVCWHFSKLTFSKISFRNAFSVSKGMDHVRQALHFISFPKVIFETERPQVRASPASLRCGP